MKGKETFHSIEHVLIDYNKKKYFFLSGQLKWDWENIIFKKLINNLRFVLSWYKNY